MSMLTEVTSKRRRIENEIRLFSIIDLYSLSIVFSLLWFGFELHLKSTRSQIPCWLTHIHVISYGILRSSNDFLFRWFYILDFWFRMNLFTYSVFGHRKFDVISRWHNFFFFNNDEFCYLACLANLYWVWWNLNMISMRSRDIGGDGDWKWWLVGLGWW